MNISGGRIYCLCDGVQYLKLNVHQLTQGRKVGEHFPEATINVISCNYEALCIATAALNSFTLPENQVNRFGFSSCICFQRADGLLIDIYSGYPKMDEDHTILGAIRTQKCPTVVLF